MTLFCFFLTSDSIVFFLHQSIHCHFKHFEIKRLIVNEPGFFSAIRPMTQWGGILGLQPPRDNLTGDTNSHTFTLGMNCTCVLQVLNSTTGHLFLFLSKKWCLPFLKTRSFTSVLLLFRTFYSSNVSQLTSLLDFYSWPSTITNPGSQNTIH